MRAGRVGAFPEIFRAGLIRLGGRRAQARSWFPAFAGGDLAVMRRAAVSLYAVLEGALLSLEYLHSELADDSEADTVTGRFMLEF